MHAFPLSFSNALSCIRFFIFHRSCFLVPPPPSAFSCSAVTSTKNTTNIALEQARRRAFRLRCRPRLFRILRGKARAGAGAKQGRKQRSSRRSWRCSGARHCVTGAFRGGAGAVGRHYRRGSPGGSALVDLVR